MKFKSVMPYNFKKIIPMLGLAGATLMTPSCSKDDKVSPDVTLTVTQDNLPQVQADGKKYAQDPNVKNIYFVIPENRSDWTNISSRGIKYFAGLLSEVYDMGNGKCHGRGDLTFEVGVGDPADSLIIVNKLGFTYNKYLQNQR